MVTSKVEFFVAIATRSYLGLHSGSIVSFSTADNVHTDERSIYVTSAKRTLFKRCMENGFLTYILPQFVAVLSDQRRAF